jgi:hypothetical protein
MDDKNRGSPISGNLQMDIEDATRPTIEITTTL